MSTGMPKNLEIKSFAKMFKDVAVKLRITPKKLKNLLGQATVNTWST